MIALIANVNGKLIHKKKTDIALKYWFIFSTKLRMLQSSFNAYCKMHHEFHQSLVFLWLLLIGLILLLGQITRSQDNVTIGWTRGIDLIQYKVSNFIFFSHIHTEKIYIKISLDNN